MAFTDYIKDQGLVGAMMLTGLNPDGTKIPAATTITHGQKDVTTAGTQVALGSATVLANGIWIKAKVGNSGVIYVGGSTVSSVTGYILAAGEEVFVEVGSLATIYIDSAVDGEGVSYIGS